MTQSPDARHGFPRLFWIANSTELLERAAFYSVASFIVIYLKETLGFSPTDATLLNGSLLWGLIYFLPPLSGTLADKFGFRGGLLLAFVMLAAGYFLMGNVQLFAGPGNYEVPIIIAIVIIGIGGSFVKPCISGTVQKTNMGKAVLAFGIFYMVINIGSLIGRLFSYGVRVNFGIPSIFWIAVVASLAGGVLVFITYRDHSGEYLGTGSTDPAKPQRSLGRVLADMLLALGDLRFWMLLLLTAAAVVVNIWLIPVPIYIIIALALATLAFGNRFFYFLLVMSGFWAMYVQIYNLIPLFLREFIDKNAAVELYTLANPIMIVAFQLLVTKFSKHFSPIRSIVFGLVIAAAGMCLNIIPVYFFQQETWKLFGLIPVAGIFMLLAIASVAVGEMLAAPRMYEYIGAVSPKGKEGLYLGYANLPMAIGTLLGGPLGGILFVEVAVKQHNPTLLWLLVAALSAFSVAGLLIYDTIVKRLVKRAIVS